jgi:tetratricopeptide (TPR) repeat protein
MAEEEQGMKDGAHFTTTLRVYMARAVRSNRDLALLTGISIRTIEKWAVGEVQRPRFVTDVLKLACALTLSEQDTTNLLRAAGHPPLDSVRAQALQTGDAQLLALLAPWGGPASQAAPAEPAAPSTPPPEPTARYQLRSPVADFVGREHEVAQLVGDLHRTLRSGHGAVISGVQGMGGIGKSELAYRAAYQMRDRFPDGQIILDLRGTGPEPLTSAQALHQAIRAFDRTGKFSDDLHELQTRYRTVLHGRCVLILADDARDAAQVRPLIPPPGCALLVTSRQRFTLPGMVTINLELLPEDAACTLLRTICPRLTAGEAQTLARLCGHLPLALRAAAGLLHNDPSLEIAAYLQRLADEQRLRHLRDPDDPDLDVAATLALSYAQLSPAQQAVFRQIGLIATDFSTALAQALVSSDIGAEEVAATLRLLLRRNLIMYDPAQERWRLHDLVRDLAQHYAAAAGERAPTMWRYVRAVMQMARATDAQYRLGGAEMLAALERFDAERPHIDTVHHWAAAHIGTEEGDQLLLDAAAATSGIGVLRYDARHARIPQWERVYTVAQRLDNQRAAWLALDHLGGAYVDQGEDHRAIPYQEQALAIARTLGDRRVEGVALDHVGRAHTYMGMPKQAIPYHEQALAIAHTLGDQHLVGSSQSYLGHAHMYLGNIRRAITYEHQALTIAYMLGNRRLEDFILHHLGRIYLMLGDIQHTIHYSAAALTLARTLGDRQIEGYAQNSLGIAHLHEGEHQCAIARQQQALTIARVFGDRRLEGYVLYSLGHTYTCLGDTPRAVTCCEGSLAVARAIGNPRIEGYAWYYLACTHSDVSRAVSAYEQARGIFQTTGDRWGISACQWQIGLALAQQGAQAQALPLLRAAIAYQREIGHTRAVKQAALLARIEADEDLPAANRLAAWASS